MDAGELPAVFQAKTDHNSIPDRPEQLTLSLDTTADNAEGQNHNNPETPYLKPDQELEGTVARIASETGVISPLVYQIIEMAMTALHKHAITNEQNIYGLLHICCQAFGLETTYHLGGIVEEVHRAEPNDGWGETLSLLLPCKEWEPLQEIAGQWVIQQQAAQWQRTLLSLHQHPNVNRYGITFLESLEGRPTLARSLIRSNTLLRTVLDRQRLAAEYIVHAVSEMGQNLQLAQREAEREFLLLPDEATAPNLNNQA